MDDVWKLTEEDMELLKESTVVLSMSGGKDSTACALLLQRNGIEFSSVFMDTGWEHPSVLTYIKETLEPRFGEVVVISSDKYPGGMKDLIKKKGFFPSRKIRYCTDELKIKPFRSFLKTLEGPIVYVVGIRREESKKRQRAERWKYDSKTDADVFSPLVNHSFEDVIAMHQQSDMRPNPLYLEGAQRVGCFPCIYSRKSEIKQMAESWPERVQEIAELERELTLARKEKDKDAPVSTFFGHRSEAIGNPDITTLVEWSKTARGGKQFELFDSTARDGCSRWGMCEAPISEKNVELLRGESGE